MTSSPPSAPLIAQPAPYEGPKKFTAEEIADGNKGIRWVTETYVAGRPTSHDVMEYLQARGDDAMCNCEKCKAFYAAPAPSQREVRMLTDEEIERLAEDHSEKVRQYSDEDHTVLVCSDPVSLIRAAIELAMGSAERDAYDRSMGEFFLADGTPRPDAAAMSAGKTGEQS